MHQCLIGMDSALAQHRHRLLTHDAEDGQAGPVTVPVLATAPLEGEQPTTAAIAVYCPFCGERLRGSSAQEA